MTAEPEMICGPFSVGENLFETRDGVEYIIEL